MPIPDRWTKSDIESVMDSGYLQDLQLVPVAVSLHGSPDLQWSVQLCRQLALHHDEIVRGNAVQAFGHLARTEGAFDESAVRPLIESALADRSEYVRGQASSAADDLQQYLGWEFPNQNRLFLKGLCLQCADKVELAEVRGSGAASFVFLEEGGRSAEIYTGSEGEVLLDPGEGEELFGERRFSTYSDALESALLWLQRK